MTPTEQRRRTVRAMQHVSDQEVRSAWHVKALRRAHPDYPHQFPAERRLTRLTRAACNLSALYHTLQEG